jgi:subtilisin family serine protease
MPQRGLRALALSVATVTLAAGLPAAPGQAAPRQVTAAKAAQQQAQPAGRSAPITITLITGDRVTLHGDRASVEAGPGRAGMRFIDRRDADHRYVIPADALPLLRSGRLDQRLFDLTTLISFGYDDRAGGLPLLVTYPTTGSSRGPAAARSAATLDGSRVVREVPGAGLLGVRVDRDSRTALWRSLTTGPAANPGLRAGVEKIWLNGKRTISLDASVPQIGAPTAWKAGLDGKGITVAVLDTGIDATHPDLKGQIVGAQNFTEDPDADDTVGHGTHVASTIAGTGTASAGRFRGVAPGAKLLNGKVCMLEGCDELWILAGMEWAAQQGAQVVNMSLGGRDTPDVDPLEKSVQDLTAKYGTLFVIAAGNSGPNASTVGSPASADTALAVGAVDRKDKLADFSSRGPRVGDDAVKPEITAPGVDIVAAKAAKDVIGDPATVKGYTTLSGTSMATPHVAGAAAILTQQHPDWSPAQRKTALMGSAKRTKGAGVFDQGAGRVDLTRAIKQTVVVESGSVSFGRALWPHTDDKAIVRTVTYRNTGSTPVTLTLKAQGSGPTGKAAPAGFFKLAASTLTVPAGGTARTTLTANTRVKAVDGVYSGYLTATAPGVQVQTPFAVNREVESYNVKLVHTNRDGTKAKDYLTVLTDLASFTSYDVFGAGPTTTLRLPKGNYGLFTWISTGSETKEDTTDDTTTMLVQPKVVVSRSSTVKLDARLGRPIKVTVPKKDAAPTLIAMGADWTGKDYGTGATAIADRFEGQFSAQIGPKNKVKGFTGSFNASFARLDAKGSAAKSPYLYDLAYYRTGSFYTGFTRAVHAKDLATLSTTYRTQGVGAQGIKSNWARIPGVGGGISTMSPFDLPLRRAEYVNAEKGVTWGSYFDEMLPPVDEEHGSEFIAGAYQPATVYRPGRTYRQEWNRAVFGPSVRGATYEGDWLTRRGNTIAGGVPLFSDGAGHIGWSKTTAARVALYRNGRLVGKSPEQYGEFAVPAAAASYRFETSAERGAPATLSTRVAAVWTFKSARVTGTKPKRLPLSSVRFSPAVDLSNTAKAGRTVEVGIGIDRQVGSTATKNKSLTVEVSYDDGRTWKRVTVRGSGDARTAVVSHPATAGFVSLRATAADTAGNTVKQTVIRAYRIA